MITTAATLVRKEDSPSGLVSFLRFKVEQPFDFSEGQFVMIDRPGVTDHEGKSVRRAYSIGTTAQEMTDDSIVGTIVKKASDFGLSAYLTEEIQVGDSVQVLGPVGHFVDDGHHPHYLFIGVGSGITPLHSIYQKITQSGKYTASAFLYGERFARHLVPSVQQLLEAHHPNTFRGLYLSQEEQLPVGWHRGYIHEGLEEALHFLGTTNLSVFLCGKPSMVDEVIEKILDHEIAKERICFEKY